MMIVKRTFPLSRIQTGAMFGNGQTGIRLWGAGNVLNITVGCASLWDHRGGMAWSRKQNYSDLHKALESSDTAAVKAMFAAENSIQPSLIPVGRLVLTLPECCKLLRYEQELAYGLTYIVYSQSGKEKTMTFCSAMDMSCDLACVGVDDTASIRLIPSWRMCDLAERGFKAPRELIFADGEAFIQDMPAAPSYSLIFKKTGNDFFVAFRRGADDADELVKTEFPPYAETEAKSRKWWSGYWADIPRVRMDDPALNEMYFHGLYKYGIMTNPEGVPPGLQGPWIEDDRLPPWAGDYHFNINVQMCNLPGLNAGKFSHMRPLFDMVLAWKEKLRFNAECFIGIKDGYMLPHAVDDRGVCMGNFWTGCIDHACSAWFAMLMFDYCDYSGDLEFLRTEVYDFMYGVMRVYEAMLERNSGDSFLLPVGVSPEYRGSAIDAWGRNPSFQLAAIHRLAENLAKAAAQLDTVPEKSWLEIMEKLPKASICNAEIALWDGLLPETSHRHHSHLAGICPFNIIDPESQPWNDIAAKSIERWTRLGMGEWVGWSMSWASQIHTRTGNGDMAVLLLNLWKTCFTNEGGGSLHDAVFKGLTVFADFRGEIMQMDGAMGAVKAIQELFLHTQNGIMRVFYGIPKHWKNVSFSEMYAPDGFRIGGAVKGGEITGINVRATRDALLKIQVPGSNILEKQMKKNESLCLSYLDNNLKIKE